MLRISLLSAFFLSDAAPPEIYTLSLHDALPIWRGHRRLPARAGAAALRDRGSDQAHAGAGLPDPGHHLRPFRRARGRSEEHTSELQSRVDLVCRLLLEKKKEKKIKSNSSTQPPS